MHGPLRIIFPCTVLAMWALLGIGIARGDWSGDQSLMLVLGALACTVIFAGFVYVFNYGYSLSVALIAVAIAWRAPSPAAWLVGAVALAFGVRMLAFTHARYGAPGYAANVARQAQADAAIPLPVRIMMWLFVSTLMGFELMALHYVARSGAMRATVVAGALVMVAGLVLETVADRQKQAAKARAPSEFVAGGLFRFARHVNYTGEMLFQAGLIVAGLGAVSGWWETAVAVIAPAYVVTLMYFAGRAADREQEARYGATPGWQAYRARSGAFLPRLGAASPVPDEHRC